MMKVPDDPPTRALRSALQYLAADQFRDVGAVARQRMLAKQRQQLQVLRRQHPHSVEPLEEPRDARSKTRDFNCHRFTFGLRGARTFRRLNFAHFAKWGRDLAIGGSFVSFLIQRAPMTEIAESTCRDGDVVVYYMHGLIMHSGVTSSAGRIRSKWGDGYVWEHAVHEVPSSYGDEVRFYSAVTLERCLEVLEQYAGAAPGSRGSQPLIPPAAAPTIISTPL